MENSELKPWMKVLVVRHHIEDCMGEVSYVVPIIGGRDEPILGILTRNGVFSLILTLNNDSILEKTEKDAHPDLELLLPRVKRTPRKDRYRKF